MYGHAIPALALFRVNFGFIATFLRIYGELFAANATYGFFWCGNETPIFTLSTEKGIA